MKKILLITATRASKNEGGPGRFTYLLFKALSSIKEKRKEVGGIFSYEYAPTVEDIVQQVASFDSGKIKRLGKRAKVREIINSVGVLGVLSYLVRLEVKKRKLNSLISQAQPTIMHCHDFETASLIKNKNSTLIFTSHYKGSAYEESIKYKESAYKKVIWKKLFKSIEKRAINNVDVITFPSAEAKGLLINEYPGLSNLIESKSKVIYTGIESLGARKNHEDGGGVILNVANHVPAKGVIDALRLMKKLRDQGKNYTLLNYGVNGPETDKLHNFVDKHKLNDCVKFCGTVSSEQLKECYYKSDLFLTTSLVTVFDLVILEAMSIGLPIVGTELKGFREALGEKYPYLSNDLETQVHFINKLLDIRKNREEIGCFMIGRFNELFVQNKMIESYSRLYNESTLKRKLG